MKLRFEYDATVTLALEAGDEIVVQHASPSVQSLLSTQRIDGKKLVRVVTPKDERAVLEPDDEMAVTAGRGRRSAAVS